MKKLREVFDPITALSVGLALCTLFAVYLTRTMLEKDTTTDALPARAITEFLDAFVPSRATVEQQQLIEKYFVDSGSSDLDHDGAGETLRRLQSVFSLNEDCPSAYRVCTTQSGFVEIMLLDSEGNDLPCRIAMLYRISGDKISSFTIWRQLPVDKQNPEWVQRWL